MSADLTVNINAVDNASFAMKKVGSSAKDLIKSFAGIATSAFSLYQSYQRISDSQLSLDRANVKLKSSANSLEDAQRRQKNGADELEDAQKNVAQVIEKYGVDSDKAAAAVARVDKATENYKAAVSDTSIAQERYDLATQNANQAQQHLNDTIAQTAVFAVPTIITLGEKMMALKFMDFASLTTSLAGVQTALNGVTASATAAWTAVAGVIGLGIYTGLEIEKYQRTRQPVPGGPVFRKDMPGMPQGPSFFGFEVPWKQKGGIFDKPTIIGVGEAGPEAVIPLEQGMGGFTINQYFTVDSWTDLSKVREAAAEGATQGISESLRRRGR